MMFCEFRALLFCTGPNFRTVLGYMLVELLAGILLRKFPARFVIGGAVLAFGVFAACFSAVKSYGPLMILRLLLGLAEGTSYNAYLYTSLWYKPHELSRRTGK